MYCPRCKKLVDAEKCPYCKKKTRLPEADDPCLVTTKLQPFAEMLSDVLEQNGIPSMLMDCIGAGLSAILGSNIEQMNVYVTYENYDKAVEIADGLFSGDGEAVEEDDTHEEPIQ